jgi:hypothetical protein
MRASFTPFVVLAGPAFLLIGCGQIASPTVPTTAASPIVASSRGSALAASPGSLPQVPFKGAFDGSDTVEPPTITTRATGTGTHLGRFSYTNVITFPARTGSALWVAANGDTIETTSVNVSSVLKPDGCSLAPGATLRCVERINTDNFTIIGGTGRFSSAEGSFTVVRTHVLAPSSDGTHVTSGSFEGTITAPGGSDKP